MGKRNAKARYRDYISAGDNEELEKFFQDNSTHHILGNDEFRQNVMANIDNHPDMPASRSERIKPDWEQVITAVSSYYKVEKEKLLAPKRGRGALTPARPVAMYLCQQVCDMKLTDIADHFGLSGYAGAGASIRNLRVQLEQDKKLSRDLNYILQDLTP